MAEKTQYTPKEYAYPSLNRKDLMSRLPLNANDFPMKKINKLSTNRNWSVNLYNLDIEGSSPHRFGSFNQKVDFTNKNDDIEKSNPRKLHIKLNKPEYNLSNEDINFSIPNCVKIKTTRNLNPLEPKYTLPKTQPIEATSPKFLRDSRQISDIEGSSPRKIMSRWFQRDTFNKGDIPSSTARVLKKRNAVYDTLNYKDVTHSEYRSKRVTNPLEPVYHLQYPSGEKAVIGSIDGNKPVVYSKYVIQDPFNLKIDDIKGSNPGSKNPILKFTGKNFMYSSSDIFGAQAGTLKRGIVTQRNVNPLVPLYKFIGHEELKGMDYNPYGKRMPKAASYTSIKEVAKVNEKADKPKDQAALSHLGKREEEERKKVQVPIDEAKEDKAQGMTDAEALPVISDVVEFDREQYKKPKPFYGNIHDPSLTPSDEDYKPKRNDLLTRKSLMIKEAGTTQGKAQELLTKSTQKNADIIEGTVSKQTYAQKLDDFMAHVKLHYIDS